MSFRLSEAEKAKILELHKKGATNADIARRIGRPSPSIAYFLKCESRKAGMSEEELTIEKLQLEVCTLNDRLKRAKKNSDEWKRKYYNCRKKENAPDLEKITQARKLADRYEKQVNILWLCINRMIDDIDHGFFDLDKFYEEAKNALDKIWIGDGCK